MARVFDVFVRGDRSTDELISHICDLLGLAFVRLQDGSRESQSQINGGRLIINIGAHDLDDDYNIPFSHYPIDVSIAVADVWEAGKREQLLQDSVVHIARKIMRSQELELLAVDNLQKIIDIQ